MALYYLETSALVKLYVREVGTPKLLELAADPAENRLAILALAPIELRSAIRRRERNGEIEGAAATHLLEAFQRHLETRFMVQPVTDFVLDVASTLIDRHALRALDAVQLAGSAVLSRSGTGAGAPIFVCSDQSLLLAARREGVRSLDPCA